jgi:hypothetical protein
MNGMTKQTEALKLALEALETLMLERGSIYDKAITAIREALALVNKVDQEQPAQQEPVDKSGSPCPKFWDWLPKAYDFEGLGNFTKYDMEVAFLAGKQSVPAQRTWVGLTDEEWQDLSDRYGLIIWGPFKREIEAKLREKNT